MVRKGFTDNLNLAKISNSHARLVTEIQVSHFSKLNSHYLDRNTVGSQPVGTCNTNPMINRCSAVRPVSFHPVKTINQCKMGMQMFGECVKVVVDSPKSTAMSYSFITFGSWFTI